MDKKEVNICYVDLSGFDGTVYLPKEGVTFCSEENAKDRSNYTVLYAFKKTNPKKMFVYYEDDFDIWNGEVFTDKHYYIIEEGATKQSIIAHIK